MFDKDLFAATLRANAGRSSTGRCARAVRIALEAAGFGPFPHPVSAKRYGPTLTALGFGLVRDGSGPLKADIVVIQPVGGRVHGHIAGYDGSGWVSDFVQRDFWPGGSYRLAKPAYAIYRFD